jgi:predicted dehydrogenase
MGTTGRVRIGFVGTGNMGQCAHLKHYASLSEECCVAAIAEPRSRLAAAVAARYAVPAVYGSAAEMLRDERLDAIVASQPFTRHNTIVNELLTAGLPIFIEKPLAGSPEAGRNLLGNINRAGARVMVGYHKRSDPATEFAKATVDRLKADGRLGRMTYCRVLMPAGDWIAAGFDDLIRSDETPPVPAVDPAPADMSEAVWQDYVRFVNYYIHQVNLIRHLIGEPYTVTYVEHSGVLMAGESRSGVPCVLEMTPYRTTLDWQESALVCFERGTVLLSLPAPLAANRPGRVELFEDPGEGRQPVTCTPQFPWESAMRRQARNFLAFVRGGTPPCDAAEAYDDLLVAEQYIRRMHAT